MFTTEAKTHLSVTELFRSIFNFYLKHFGSLCRVMIPIVILGLILQILVLCVFYTIFPDMSWNVSTSLGFSPTSASDSSFTLTFSSVYYVYIWFGLFLLVLTTHNINTKHNFSINSVIHHAYRNKSTIFGAGILCLAWCIAAVFTWLFIQITLEMLFNFSVVVILNILGFFFVLIYFFVRWSLIHQCIIIENLPALRAFRRSSELTKGNWTKLLGRYLLLAWISCFFSNLIMAFIYLLLSSAVPELLPMREEILSTRFFTLLFGIPISLSYNNFTVSVGEISMNLPNVPSFWVIVVLDFVYAFILAIVAPLWAILTTHLYLEQTGRKEANDETHVNAIEVQI